MGEERNDYDMVLPKSFELHSSELQQVLPQTATRANTTRRTSRRRTTVSWLHCVLLLLFDDGDSFLFLLSV